MSDLLTSAQMRAIERAAIESGATTGLRLMECAGEGVVGAILEAFPRLATSGRAVVLCGPGNNGGDGFVVARLLHARGWSVAVFLFGDAPRLPPDARANHDRWAALGAVHPLDDPRGGVYGAFGREAPDLVIDALFGTGLTRDLPGSLQQALAEIGEGRRDQRTSLSVVAVDAPSGLCADSGRVRGTVLRADLTVTFHTAKPGHYLAGGPATCGALQVVDIGLPQRAPDRRPAPEMAELIDGAPHGIAKSGGHKYDHGHVLVLGGGMGRTGAARLAGRGALRIGAGLVTLGVPGSAMLECAAQITALMLRRVGDAADLTALLADRRITALCLGPGIGGARAQELLPVALASGRELVLDADALTALAQTPQALPAGCVVTPHGGEFARLFPDLAARLTAHDTTFSKLDAARQAAARVGCVVLLKGADTVIAAPDGRAALHAAAYGRAAPWLATAGAGDVLAAVHHRTAGPRRGPL